MQMMNGTYNWLNAKRSVSMIVFARTLANYSVMLFGPGQLATVGVPLPANGRLKRMMVYDGTNVRTVNENIEFKATDLLSVTADYANPYFTIVAQIGLSATGLAIDQVSGNRDVWASLLIELTDDDWSN